MKRAFFLLAIVAISAATPLARAASTQTWTGLTSTSWTNSGNWTSAVPVSTDTALFNGAGNGNTSITLGGASQPINTIQFSTASAAAYSLGVLNSGDKFDFDAGGAITLDSTVTSAQTINAAVQTNGNLAINNSGNLTLAGNIDIGSSGTLSVTNTGASRTVTLGGNITGTGGQLTLTGTTAPSTFIINGTNTYTGGTTITVNTGTTTGGIQIGTDSPFGTGKVTTIVSTASPQLQANGGNRTIANTFDLNGGLTFIGTTNSFTFTGPMTVINAAAGSAVGRTLNESVAGTVTFGSSASPSTITLGNPVSNGGDNVGKTLILNAVTGGSIIVNDVMQDPATGGGSASGLVSMTGSGSAQLNGQNTYSGGTSVTGAGFTVQVGSSSTLSGPTLVSGPLGTSTVTFNNTTTNPKLQAIGASQSVANNIVLLSSFIAQGTQNITLSGSITNSGSNRTIFSSIVGTTATTTLSGPIYLSETSGTGRTLSLSTTGTTSPVAVFLVSGNVSNFNGVGGTAGNLTIGGTSAATSVTATLSGTNTHTGNTTLNTSSLLKFGSAGALGGSTFVIGGNGSFDNITGGPLTFSNNINLSGGSPTFVGTNDISFGSNTVAISGATGRSITTTAGTLTIGSITQDVAGRNFTKAGAGGTLVITGAGSYTGTTTITGGTLQLGNGGTTGSLSTGSVITDSGNFTINRSNAVVQGTDFSGSAISGTGSFTQAGGGTTTLNVANSYSGATNITGGTLSSTNASALGSAPKVTVSTGATLNVGVTQTVHSLNSAASNTGAVTLGANELTIGAAATNLDSTFAGVISDSAGTGSVVKAGTGTLVLTGSNTYGGDTTINAGVLKANNTPGGGSSATGTGTIGINSGGTLAGTGAVAGGVFINNGGHLAPGTSIESLATGALTFNPGGTLDYEINSSAPLASAADLVDANGDLKILNGAKLNMTDSGNTVLSGIKLTLISYGGTWNLGTFQAPDATPFPDDSPVTIGVNTYTLNYNDGSGGSNFGGGSYGKFVTLSIAAVPEANGVVLGSLVCIVVGLATGGKKLLRRRAATLSAAV